MEQRLLLKFEPENVEVKRNYKTWRTKHLPRSDFGQDEQHLQNLFEEGELTPEATIRKFRIVRQEGKRQVARLVDHFNLDQIRFNERYETFDTNRRADVEDIKQIEDLEKRLKAKGKE